MKKKSREFYKMGHHHHDQGCGVHCDGRHRRRRTRQAKKAAAMREQLA